MAEHDWGTAMIFARTDTDAFFRYVWERASALLFMRGRVNFHLPDGTRAPANSGAPSVLCAYGADDADVLAACRINGQFMPLRLPRSVVIQAAQRHGGTWAELLADFFKGRDGTIELAEVYRYFRGTPKAQANPHFEAKLRQQLQLGPYKPAGRGRWRAAIG